MNPKQLAGQEVPRAPPMALTAGGVDDAAPAAPRAVSIGPNVPRLVRLGLRVLPPLMCLVFLAMYTFLAIYARTSGTYTSNIDLPYFSDTGRDRPAYYVFAVGLSFCAFVVIGIHVALLYRFLPVVSALAEQSGVRVGIRRHKTLLKTNAALGVFSAPFLAMVGLFPTDRYSVAHSTGSLTFFSCSAASMMAYLVSFRRVAIWTDLAEPASCVRRRVHRALRVKMAIAGAFLLSCFVYVPFGLSATFAACGKSERLSMADCLGREDLGLQYCEEKKGGGNDTVLWDYSDCKGWHTMRSASQFLSIAFIVLFKGSTFMDFGICDECRVAALPEEGGMPPPWTDQSKLSL